MTQTIVYILIGINVLTFVIYGIDKWKAKRAKWRIREAVLLGLAVFGGSIGALLGMQRSASCDAVAAACIDDQFAVPRAVVAQINT